MFETMMTVVGHVTDTPQVRRTKSGHLVANFRVASNARRYDGETGQWKDSNTLFLSVTAWRNLGEGVAESVHKGQPVIVTGRFSQREYTVDEQVRTVYELEATAVGHNLALGSARFDRAPRLTPVSASPAELGTDRPLGVDESTGEVRELAAVG